MSEREKRGEREEGGRKEGVREKRGERKEER